jgi:CDP-diglyceride synthetase
VAIVLVVSTIIGDLFFSWLKRNNGIKDFSNILPGHGGILDRMDAFIFVTATFGALMLGISIVTAIYNNDPCTIFPNFNIQP